MVSTLDSAYYQFADVTCYFLELVFLPIFFSIGEPVCNDVCVRLPFFRFHSYQFEFHCFYILRDARWVRARAVVCVAWLNGSRLHIQFLCVLWPTFQEWPVATTRSMCILHHQIHLNFFGFCLCRRCAMCVWAWKALVVVVHRLVVYIFFFFFFVRVRMKMYATNENKMNTHTTDRKCNCTKTQFKCAVHCFGTIAFLCHSAISMSTAAGRRKNKDLCSLLEIRRQRPAEQSDKR